jgi:hypothetical protein
MNFNAALGLAVLTATALALADAPPAAPLAHEPPVSTAKMAPVAPATPAASEPLTPAQAKSLLPEFQKAQAWELKALEHRNKLELKELKASQSARQKDWNKREREARHKYFAEHTRGPERRAYIRDFMDRQRAFRQLLADELKQRTQEQDARMSALKSDQSQRLKEFKDALGRNERPAARLWPSAS